MKRTNSRTLKTKIYISTPRTPTIIKVKPIYSKNYVIVHHSIQQRLNRASIKTLDSLAKFETFVDFKTLHIKHLKYCLHFAVIKLKYTFGIYGYCQ